MESGTGSFTPAPVMVHPLTVFLGGQNVVPRAGTAASSEDASAHSSISLPFDSDSSDDDDSSFVDGIYVGSASTRRLSAAAGPLTLRAQANRRAKVSSDSKKRLAPKHLTPSSLKRHAGQRRSRRYMNDRLPSIFEEEDESVSLMDNRSSLFADLFAPENADVATVFRAGLEGALLSPAAGSLSSSAVKPSVSNDASTLWRKIDRRLRPHLEREYAREREHEESAGGSPSTLTPPGGDAVGTTTVSLSKLTITSEHSVPFLEAAEALLTHFLLHGDVAPPRKWTGPFLSACSGVYPAVVVMGGAVALSLPLNNPYHRLIMHAMAQFYCLRTHSVDAGTSRSLFVSVCKNSVKSVCVDGVPLSLLRHLHATAEESTQ